MKFITDAQSFTYHLFHLRTATVVVSVRAITSQTEGWAFESQPRRTLVVKTGIDSSTAKRSAIGVSVTGPMK